MPLWGQGVGMQPPKAGRTGSINPATGEEQKLWDQTDPDLDRGYYNRETKGFQSTPYVPPPVAAEPPTPMGPGPSLPYTQLTLSGYGNGQRGFGSLNYGRNQTEDFLRYLEGLRWQYMRSSMPQFNIFGRLG